MASLRVPIALVYLLLAAVGGCQSSPAKPPQPASSPPSESGALEKFEYVQMKWGTGFRIVMYAPDEPVAKIASDAAFARIDELTPVLSDYDPASELSRLSNLTREGPMAQPVKVSDDLFRVLEASQEAARKTGGAFDVTVGPFVRLWRRAREMKQLPTQQRLEKTRASVGYQHLKLDPQARTAQLLAPRMRLDVGGIASGYAVDEALKVMRKQGVTRALIDGAGDLAVGDPPPGKAGWRVAIQALEAPERSAGYVELRNAAVSTSGDTYRYVQIDGRRYSHIIDPRTGLGLTNRLGATVIAPDGMTADWLDTAAPVLGREKALALVEQTPGAAARLTTIDGGRITVDESERFGQFRAGPEGAP